jgi:CelD/BcsL family acetyltransferase involved in cellulose biosynthesis
MIREVDRPPALSLSIVRDQASFDSLKGEWEDLFQLAAVQMPFLRYSWMQLCWGRHRVEPNRHLFIIVVRDGGRVVLIAPFVARRRLLLFWDLSFLDSLTPQYNDVLVEKSPRSGEYVGYLCAALRKMHRIRRLRLNWIREDSLLLPHLASMRQTAKTTDGAPYIDLTRFAGWEAFLGSLPKKLRSDHGRQLRHLQRLGSVNFSRANESSLLADIEWLFTEKRAWLDRTRLSSPWFTAPGTEKLFTAAAAEGLASGRTWLFNLLIDGKTIGSLLCFREGRTLYLSKIAYDPAWQQYSPGRTMMLLSIEHAFKEGLEKCDLMIGEGAWKLSIAKAAVVVSHRRVTLHYP